MYKSEVFRLSKRAWCLNYKADGVTRPVLSIVPTEIRVARLLSFIAIVDIIRYHDDRTRHTTPTAAVSSVSSGRAEYSATGNKKINNNTTNDTTQ